MTLQRLLAEFDELDAVGVAERLRREGVKGKKHNCIECPLANWLVRHGVSDPIVGHDVSRDLHIFESVGIRVP